MRNLRDLLVVLLLIGLLVASWFMHGVRRVPTDHNVVALTFDDGPNPPYTDELLTVLAEKNVKATFFLIGKQIEQHPETAYKIITAGHELGGHSSDWDTLAFKNRRTVDAKLDAMQQSFFSIGITNLTLFRPPGGMLFPGQSQILEQHGLVHISADVVVGDWKNVNAEKIRDRVVKKVRPGSIIALHDGGGNRTETIAAVKIIIDELRARGYSFSSVSDLIKQSSTP